MAGDPEDGIDPICRAGIGITELKIPIECTPVGEILVVLIDEVLPEFCRNVTGDPDRDDEGSLCPGDLEFFSHAVCLTYCDILQLVPEEKDSGSGLCDHVVAVVPVDVVEIGMGGVTVGYREREYPELVGETRSLPAVNLL